MTAKIWSFFSGKSGDQVVKSNPETKPTIQIDLDAKVSQAEKPAKSSWCDCIKKLSCCGERPARRQTVSLETKSPTAHTTLVSTPRTPPDGTMQTPVEPMNLPPTSQQQVSVDTKDQPSVVEQSIELMPHSLPPDHLSSQPITVNINAANISRPGEFKEEKGFNNSLSESTIRCLRVLKVILTFGFLGSLVGTYFAVFSKESTKTQAFNAALWGLFGGSCVGLLSFASKQVRRFIRFLTTHSPVPITLQGMAMGSWRTKRAKLISAATSPLVVAMVFCANIMEVLRRIKNSKASKNLHERSSSESKSQLSANQAQLGSSEIASNQTQNLSRRDWFWSALPTLLVSGGLIVAGVFGGLRAESSFLYSRLSQLARDFGIISILEKITPTTSLEKILRHYKRHKNFIQNIFAFLASIGLSEIWGSFSYIGILLVGFVLIGDNISRKIQIETRRGVFEELVRRLSANPQFVQELKKLILDLKQVARQMRLQAANQQDPSYLKKCWESIKKCFARIKAGLGKIIGAVTLKKIFMALFPVIPIGYFSEGFPGLVQYATAYLGLLTIFWWSKLRTSVSLNAENIWDKILEKLLRPAKYLAKISMTPLVMALAYYVNNWWSQLFNGLDENSPVPGIISFLYAPIDYLLFYVTAALLFAWLYSPRKSEEIPEAVAGAFKHFLGDNNSRETHRSTVSIELLEKISNLLEEKNDQDVTQIVVTPRHAQQQTQALLSRKEYKFSPPTPHGGKLYGQITCEQGFFRKRMLMNIVGHDHAAKPDSSLGARIIAVTVSGDIYRHMLG